MCRFKIDGKMDRFLDIVAWILVLIIILALISIFVYCVVFISEARLALSVLCLPIVIAWALSRVFKL
jgi:hypothetical protein